MGLKRDFVEKWMQAERLAKGSDIFHRKVSRARKVEAPPLEPATADRAAPVTAGETSQAAPAPPPASEPTITEAARSSPPALVPFADMDVWYLSSDMQWTLPAGARTIVVPRGFSTDFASVPQSFWLWMPPTGRYGLPAMVHDWLYWDQTLLRSQADDIFDGALADLDVSRWRRFILFRAVRWFGGKYWRENSRAKQQGQGRVLRMFPDDARITWTDWRKRPGVFV